MTKKEVLYGYTFLNFVLTFSTFFKKDSYNTIFTDMVYDFLKVKWGEQNPYMRFFGDPSPFPQIFAWIGYLFNSYIAAYLLLLMKFENRLVWAYVLITLQSLALLISNSSACSWDLQDLDNNIKTMECGTIETKFYRLIKGSKKVNEIIATTIQLVFLFANIFFATKTLVDKEFTPLATTHLVIVAITVVILLNALLLKWTTVNF